MIEPRGCAGCCVRGETYCDPCDLLVGLPGLHVVDVFDNGGDKLTVTVESPPAEQGCRACGVIAEGHGRRTVSLVDAPVLARLGLGSGPAAGTTWRTVWRSIAPLLQAMADDPGRFDGVTTLDPFHGYKNAIDDQLQDATSVLDAFHVVKLAGQAVDVVRRRVQQAIHGHRGRKDDPLQVS